MSFLNTGVSLRTRVVYELINFAKSLKFLKNINVLGEKTLIDLKIEHSFVIVAIQKNISFPAFGRLIRY